MDPGTALGLGALVSGIGSGLGLLENSQNLNFQKENLAYQKDLQNRLFEREDNSVQRRAADLKAAGLSKTLAAGSSANAGAVVKTEAPKNNYSDKIMGALSLMNTFTNIAQSQSQTELNKMQAKVSAETINKMASDTNLSQIEMVAKMLNYQKDIEFKDSQIKNNKMNYNIGGHNLKLGKKYGTPVGTDVMGNIIGAGVKGVGTILKGSASKGGHFLKGYFQRRGNLLKNWKKAKSILPW